jgi:hypothetical protein
LREASTIRMETSSLSRWLPYKLTADSNDRLCQWLYIGDNKFTEPFFDETILRCRQFKENSQPFRQVSMLEMMLEWSDGIESIPPAAFIFHVSRCGSTLLSQMLALNNDHIVLSEVPYLDELLRLPFAKDNPIGENTSNQLFQTAMKFYGQVRNEKDPKAFVKTDSWHLFFYDRLRALYPEALFILLYRSPADIIRSQNRMRGMQSIPGVLEKEVFGFTEADTTYNLDVYMSRVLEKYYAAILNIISSDPKFLLVNYDEGMLPIMQKIISLISIDTSPGYVNKMEERVQFDAKRPGYFFNAEKSETITPHYLSRCIELYEQLERTRIEVDLAPDKVH